MAHSDVSKSTFKKSEIHGKYFINPTSEPVQVNKKLKSNKR